MIVARRLSCILKISHVDYGESPDQIYCINSKDTCPKKKNKGQISMACIKGEQI